MGGMVTEGLMKPLVIINYSSQEIQQASSWSLIWHGNPLDRETNIVVSQIRIVPDFIQYQFVFSQQVTFRTLFW